MGKVIRENNLGNLENQPLISEKDTTFTIHLDSSESNVYILISFTDIISILCGIVGRRQRQEKMLRGRYRRAVREVAVSVSFCVPHGFIPFSRRFIHTPSLAHSVIVTLALSHSFHPFLFSSSPFHPRSICLRPTSRALYSSPSPHLHSTPFTVFLASSADVLFNLTLFCLFFLFPVFMIINSFSSKTVWT